MGAPTPNGLSVSLSADELAEVFLALDELDPEGAGADRRQHERHLCRDLDSVVLVLNPEQRSKRSAHRVIPNDLSSGGGSVLLGQMLFPDTRCALMLQNLEGKFVALRCTVRRCRFITRRVHEVALVFNEPIRVSDFLALDAPLAAPEDPSPPAESAAGDAPSAGDAAPGTGQDARDAA